MTASRWTLLALRSCGRSARHPKRTGGPGGSERIVDGRDPIGKFGIGKRATYVLAEELTYICRRDEGYLAVTMDYSRVLGDTDLSAKATVVVGEGALRRTLKRKVVVKISERS